jgi:hypothetical protein
MTATTMISSKPDDFSGCCGWWLSRNNLEQLELRASSLSNDISCQVEMPEIGKDGISSMMCGMNLHIRIVFEDEICWLARIRCSKATSPSPELRDRICEIEIQTLVFLETTNIPTAKVRD